MFAHIFFLSVLHSHLTISFVTNNLNLAPPEQTKAPMVHFLSPGKEGPASHGCCSEVGIRERQTQQNPLHGARTARGSQVDRSTILHGHAEEPSVIGSPF